MRLRICRRGRAAAPQRNCRSLAAGFAQRLRVMAVAGLPAALYGIGQSAWPARLLALARRDALRAIKRSTFRMPPEAFNALARTWWEDAGAWASVAPWRFVHIAQAAGWGSAAVADLLLHTRRLVGRWPPCAARFPLSGSWSSVTTRAGCA